MQNEISMGDVMNAINSLETKQSNQLSQVILGVEARLNITTSELMSAIQALDGKFERKLENLEIKIDRRFDQTDSEIADIHEMLQVFSSATDEQFRTITNEFNGRFVKIESQMVTKNYLDEKMGGLRGDMIQRIRTGFPKLAV